MFVSTAAALLLGRMALKDRRIMQELFDITSFKDLKKMLFKAVSFVLAVEAAGAIALAVLYFQKYSFFKSIYFGVFSAISAFCNAGFFLYEDSLASYANDPLILAVFSILIISGGIGFFVLVDIYDAWKEKRLHLSLHSKVVFTATGIILAVSFLFFIIYGSLTFFKGESILYALSNSFFSAASARTAGFNTIDMSVYNGFSKMLLIIFMAIGAAPASTAGGLKVTTLVIIIAFIRSFLKSQSEVVIFKKRISEDIVKKASIIFILFTMLTAAFSAVLILLEIDKYPIDILFETVSAFSTTGLSMNTTPNLSQAGRIVIILAMATGRIGILTLLISVIDVKHPKVRYPEDKILVG